MKSEINLEICAYSGKRGAYAQLAVDKYFNKKVKSLAVDSFKSIFESVEKGCAQYGMVPIENSTAGSVYENYDNFTIFKNVHIIGTTTLKIEHSLLACKDDSIETIKHVYSHPQALCQCSNFLEQHKDWAQTDTVSTATAASIVSSKKSIDCAAIADAGNAEIYGLKVLKSSIQNNEDNFTRFVVIANKPRTDFPKGKLVASLSFCTENKPGALYECLGIIKNCHLNLTRLESRPIPQKPWTYRFFTDAILEEQIENPTEYIASFLKKMKDAASDIKLLGLYPESES